jgi:hypothetical protein
MAGGGIGEAMLIGAAMGGGSAAITGGDPLKGALLGGLTGGAGAGISGGISSLLPAAAETLPAALPGAASAIPSATAAIAPTATALEANGLGSALGSTGGVNGAAASIPTATIAPSAEALSANGFGAATGNVGSAPLAVPSGAPTPAFPATGGTFTEGMARFADNPIASIKANPFTAGASALAGAVGARRDFQPPDTSYNGPLSRFKFDPSSYRSAFAEGGIANLASGGYDRMVGEEPMYPANMASGGISNLGTYSDGGRMLRGPGDGMSDSIPGVIGGKRPARLADGEFVVPADVVSHLGNGSTDAGAKHLYSMMDKVRSARTGRKAQGREINPSKYMPAYA